MEIKSISISKATYGPNVSKYTASIELKGGRNYPADINIGIPNDALLPIISIIQQAVVESMARSAQEFADSVALSLASPEASQQVITHG